METRDIRLLDAATCDTDNPNELLSGTHPIFRRTRMYTGVQGGDFQHLLPLQQ
jgi:hypothetical protein